MSYWEGPSRVSPLPNSGMATASLVLGLSGIFLSWCLFGVPSILAIIFGIVALPDTKPPDASKSGYGMALTGLVTGGVVVLAFVAFILITGSLSVLGMLGM